MDERKIVTTIAKVMPAVVSILISKPRAQVEREMTTDIRQTGSPSGGKGAIPPDLLEADGMVRVGSGSGFLADPDGLVLTNKHVISDIAAKYAVVLNDGRTFPANVVSRDPINDVAMLKIEAHKLPFLKLGDSCDLKLGQTTIAIGNVLGLFKNTVSAGIISGLSRSISAQANPRAPLQEMRGLIQTDAAINPGNSGGPLVNNRGLVIGINAAIVSGAQNIGFAIPINAARRDLQDMKKYGEIRRPYLGIRYFILDEKISAEMKLTVTHGALIINEGPQDHGVIPGSPAAAAGLREGDIILECNEQKIDCDHSIQDFLENLAVGETMNLQIQRDKETFDTKVILAQRK